MADRYWVGGAGTWDASSTTRWSVEAALSLTSASCSGTALTTTGSPALVVGMTVWSSTNVSLGTIVSGSDNSWVVSVGGTYASQTMTAATIGASAPTSTDNVFITATSGTGTITCTSAVCNDLTVTASQALTLGAVFSTLAISGNLTLPSGGSFQIFTANSWTITFNRTTGTQIITTNGKLLCLINQNGPGGTLQFPAGTTTILNSTTPNLSTYTFTAGTLDLGTNTSTLVCGGFVSSNSNSRVIAFGTGNITINDRGQFNFTDSTNFSYTGTPTVNISSSAGSVLLNTNFTSSNALDINITTGSYTISLNAPAAFKSLNFTGFTGTWNTRAVTFYGNLTFSSGMTVTNPTPTSPFTFSPSSGQTITITSAGKTLRSITQSGAGGTVRLADNLTLETTSTYYLDTGTLDLNNFALSTGLFSSSTVGVRAILFGTSNITTTGSGTVFYTAGINFTYTGTPTINISNNSSSATTVWASSTGGTEANALNFNITTGTYAFTLQNASRVKSLNFTGFTGSWSPSSTNATFYGNLTLVSGMSFTPGSGTWTFAATSGTQTITSAGKTLRSITQSGAGGTVSLVDTLNLSQTLTVTNGTFNANNQNITANNYSLTGGAVTMGSGTWTVTGTTWNANGTTITANTSTIAISDTTGAAIIFSGGGNTYYNLNLSGITGNTALRINQSNTFNQISSSKTVAYSVSLEIGTTTTVSSWVANGSAGNLLTLNSTAPGTQAILNKTGGGTIVIDYISIRDSSATPDSTWYATNSINNGNNLGWGFQATSTPFSNYFLMF